MQDTEEQHQQLMTSLLAEEGGETLLTLVPQSEQTSSTRQKKGTLQSGDWCLRGGLFCILCCLILIFIPLITACAYLSFMDNELITTFVMLDETIQQPHAQFMATPTCNTDYYESLIQYGTEGDYTCVYSYLMAYCANEDSKIDIYYTSEGLIYDNSATTDDDDYNAYDDDFAPDDDDYNAYDDDFFVDDDVPDAN